MITQKNLLKVYRFVHCKLEKLSQLLIILNTNALKFSFFRRQVLLSSKNLVANDGTRNFSIFYGFYRMCMYASFYI